jgi:hypothetical protein
VVGIHVRRGNLDTQRNPMDVAIWRKDHVGARECGLLQAKEIGLRTAQA